MRTLFIGIVAVTVGLAAWGGSGSSATVGTTVRKAAPEGVATTIPVSTPSAAPTTSPRLDVTVTLLAPSDLPAGWAIDNSAAGDRPLLSASNR